MVNLLLQLQWQSSWYFLDWCLQTLLNCNKFIDLFFKYFVLLHKTQNLILDELSDLLVNSDIRLIEEITNALSCGK